MSQKISGIYKITNEINGKVYIGQSSDIKARWNHEHGGKSTKNIYLKKDIEKFGLKNFKYEILIEENDLNKRNLLEKEFIKKYNSTEPELGYNISTGGNCNYTHSEQWKREQSLRLKSYYKEKPNWLTEERREKLKQAGKYKRTEEWKKQVSIRRKGCKHSEETKKKISLMNKKRIERGDSNNPFLDKEKHKEIIKLASEAKYKKVKCVETGEIFSSVKEAKEKYGKGIHISDCCNKTRKIAAGYHWEWI